MWVSKYLRSKWVSEWVSECVNIIIIIIIITKWRGYMTIFLRCVSSPWWWLPVCKSKHLALKPHDSISRSLVDSRPWSSQLTNFHHSWMSRLQVICLLLPRRETSPNLQNNRFGPRLRASLAYWFLPIPRPIIRFKEIEWFWKYFLQIKQKQPIIPQNTRTRCHRAITRTYRQFVSIGHAAARLNGIESNMQTTWKFFHMYSQY